MIAQLLTVECKRFRMAEFGGEYGSEQLFGPPAGYAGYEKGGILTNSVRDDPCGVLVFEDIERANSRIFDSLLQVIEEGQVIDSRGAVADFSNSTLIFTTSLGMTVDDGGRQQVLVQRDAPADEIASRITEGARVQFERQLGQSEFFNLLEHGIVVFDFLRNETARDIARHAINKIIESVRDRYGLTLEIEDTVIELLLEHVTEDLTNGSQSVRIAIDAWLLSPLSRQIFTDQPVRGEIWRVTEIIRDGREWRFTLSKSA